MAKSSVTIAIAGQYNGRAFDKAEAALRKMQVTAASTMGGVGSSLANAGAQFAVAGNNIDKYGKKLQTWGANATRNISLPIAAAAAACGYAAVEIDTALTGVRKTVDATEQEYVALKDAAIEYSKTDAISATELLNAEEYAGQLGVAKENLQEFGIVATGLDLSTNMDLESASMNMARFANLTHMSADEYRDYGNTIVAIGNNFATTESEVSDFSLAIASAGTQAGMSQADIMGISGAMTSLGLTVQAGGSSFSRTITEISTAVSTGSSDLEAYAQVAGMSADQFAQAWKGDATEAFISFVKGLSTSGEDLNVTLEELGITELRQSDAMRRLASNTDLVREAVDMANTEWEGGSALADEVANKNESLASKLEMLKNRVIAVAESVGVPLVNAALGFADAAEPVLGLVADAAQGFADMDEGSQRVAVGVLAAAAAFGPCATVVGKLTSASGKLVASSGKFLQSMAIEITGVKDLTKEQAKAVIQKNLSATATTAETAATKQCSRAMAAGKVAATSLKGALLTIAPMAVIALLVAAGSAIKGIVDECNTYRQATDGIVGAIDSASAAYGRSITDVGNQTVALSDNSRTAKEAAESQAQLAEKCSSTWSEVGANAGMVDAYAQTIGQLADKSNLTATEQAQLKVAVDGFNSMCGTSISIIDPLNGKLSEQKDAIYAVANAYREQAMAEAAQSLLTDVYREKIQAQVDLKAAQDAYNESLAAQNAAIEEGSPYVQSYISQTANAESQLNKTNERLNALNTTEQQYIGIITEAGAATGSSAADLEKFIQNSTGLEEAAEAMGTSVDALSPKFSDAASSLSQIGVSTSDLQGVSASALAGILSNYSGNLTELVEMCRQAGIDIPAGLEEGITAGSDTTSTSGQVLAQGIIDMVNNTLETHSPSQVMYRTGADIDTGLSQGIDGSASLPQGSALTLGGLIKDAISDLPGFGSGIGTGAGTMLSAALQACNGLASGAGSIVSGAAEWGLSLIDALGIGSGKGSDYSSGIGSQEGSARGSAQSLSTAAEAMREGDSRSWGSEMGGNFADGIKSAYGWVRDAASSIAGAVADFLHFTEPEEGPLVGINQSGYELGRNYAASMQRAVPYVAAASASMAKAASFDAYGSYGSTSADRGGRQESQSGTYIFNVSIDAKSLADISTVEALIERLRLKQAAYDRRIERMGVV